MVNDYILFINNEDPSPDENNSDYITEGIRKLSRAIGAIADEKYQTDSER